MEATIGDKLRAALAKAQPYTNEPRSLSKVITDMSKPGHVKWGPTAISHNGVLESGVKATAQ